MALAAWARVSFYPGSQGGAGGPAGKSIRLKFRQASISGLFRLEAQADSLSIRSRRADHPHLIILVLYAMMEGKRTFLQSIPLIDIQGHAHVLVAGRYGLLERSGQAYDLLGRASV